MEGSLHSTEFITLCSNKYRRAETLDKPELTCICGGRQAHFSLNSTCSIKNTADIDPLRFWTKDQIPQFISSWSVVFKHSLTEVWPSFTLVYFHVLIWLKNAWKSTKTSTDYLTYMTKPPSLRKLIFREALWERDLLVALMPYGNVVRAGLKLSGFDAPSVPSSNPWVSEINSDTGLKSQNREILFRWTDWLKRGKDECVVELSCWYSHLGVLQWWKPTGSSVKTLNVCSP